MRAAIIASLCVVLLLAAAGVVAQTTPRRAVICAFTGWTSGVTWTSFARRYYAPLFPDTAFEFKLLESGSAVRGYVSSYLVNGTDCDALTVVASSSNALALSPLIPDRLAWIDASATSDELSNKQAHPTFTRVVPTDKVGAAGAAQFAIRQGWTMLNVMCVDVAYGRSVSEGFSQKFQELGGQIEYSRCIPSSATAQDVAAALRPIMESASSRVIFFAGTVGGFEGMIRDTGAHTKLIWILSEASCSNSTSIQYFPGAFCANYAVSDQFAAYSAAYLTRDVALDAAHAPVIGATAANDRNPPGFWAAMMADAVRLAMHAIDRYPTANQTRYPSRTLFARSVTFEGLTGLVSVGADGNRIDAAMSFNNVQPMTSGTNTSAYQLVSLGTGSNGTFTAAAGASTAYYYGLDGLGWQQSPPSALKPVPLAKAARPYWVIAIVGAFLVLLGAMAGYFFRQRRLRANCPLDGNVPFTVMFVSVKNEARVRDAHPATCAKAFAEIAQMVRRAARRHGCHEARRVNETTLMLVSKRPEQCVAAAAEVQLTAANTQWDSKLNEKNGDPARAAKADHSRSHTLDQSLGRSAGTLPRSDKSRRTFNSGTSTVRGASVRSGMPAAGPRRRTVAPRLNIGIHTGLGEIDHDEELGVLSYHGAVVDRAAYVADAAVGGHIVVTEGTLELLPDEGQRPRGSLTPYREVTIPSGSAAVKKSEQASLMLHTFMPQEMPQEESIINRIDKAITAAQASDDDAGGGIAAAMTAADTGVSRRRVAIVCLHVPALLNHANGLTDVAHAKLLRSIAREVCDVAAEHKGVVKGITDGRITVSVNATGPHVTQPEARAAHIAHRVAVELAHADGPFRGTTAGVATGRSMEGSVEGLPASVGAVNATARAMQLAAASLGVACAANDASYDDLCASFRCVTVDAVALGDRVTRVLAVLEPRDVAADGEWLYQMDNAPSACAVTAFESRWHALANGLALPSVDDVPVASTDADDDEHRCTDLSVRHLQLASAAAGGYSSYAEDRAASLRISL